MKIPSITDAPCTQDSHAAILALQNDSVAQRVIKRNDFPATGDLVGVRLNLNLLKSTGIAAQTLHRGSGMSYQKNTGLFRGLARGYAQVVHLKDAYFNVNQTSRENIAGGSQNKHPMASIDGLFEQDNPEHFQGVEIRFNPKNHHLFVDEHGQAIHYAEEVLIIGHRAYARGHIIYHSLESSPKRKGDQPTQTKILETEHTIHVGMDGCAHENATQKRRRLA